MNDDMFGVGLQVSVETPARDHHLTHIIGWEKELFIMTGLMYCGGKPAAVKPADRCKMRLLKDGIAYGFETEIESIQFHPHPVMFLKYPSTIEQMQIRRFTRMKTSIPAKLLDANGLFIADTVIIDISAGGCGMNLPLQGGRDLLADHAKAYVASFSILDESLKLRCLIKKVRACSEILSLGVEFQEPTRDEQRIISSFLEIIENIASSNLSRIFSRVTADGAKLGGNLDELALPDILQVLEQSKKEGILYINAGRESGIISVRNGFIMDASFGPLTGEDALVGLLSLKEGGFHYYAKPVPTGSFEQPVGLMLMEACRLIDERSSLEQHIPTGHDELMLQTQPDGKDHDIKAVASVFQGETSRLDEIILVSGLSRIRTVIAVARMLRTGLIQRIGKQENQPQEAPEQTTP